MKKVESLFEHARADALSSEEMEKLWRNVATAGAAGGMGGGEGAPGGAGRWLGGGSGTAMKALAGLVVAGGIATAVLAGRKAQPAPSAPPPSVAMASPRGADAPSTEAAPPVVAFDDLPHARGQPTAPAKSARARSEGPVGAMVASPAVNVPATPPAIEAPEAPGALVAAHSPPPVAASPSEGALLLQARRYLASDPASALALTDDAARRFSDGPLAPEREVLAIEALARMGRAAEARTRLTAFRARYPQSPHLARLDSLVSP